MLETFPYGGRRDSRQRYSGSYGFFTTETKNKLLMYIREVNEDHVTFLNERGIEFTAYADMGTQFEFIPISKRLFQLEGQIYYIARRPARQWQRGIASGNVVLQCLTTDFGARTIGFPTVMASLESVIPPKMEELLNYTDAGSLLLNKMFCIVRGKLFLYNNEVGFYKDKTFVVQPLFKQEVADFCKRQGYSVSLQEQA